MRKGCNVMETAVRSAAIGTALLTARSKGDNVNEHMESFKGDKHGREARMRPKGRNSSSERVVTQSRAKIRVAYMLGVFHDLSESIISGSVGERQEVAMSRQ